MRTRHLALAAAVAATAAILPAATANSEPRPREAGCYDIGPDTAGTEASVRRILEDAQLKYDVTRGGPYVERTHYADTLAVAAHLALGSEASPASGCGVSEAAGAQYSLLVYPATNDAELSSTLPVQTVAVPGQGGSGVDLTAWVSGTSNCVGVRLRVQDGAGRVIDDAPNADLPPAVRCLELPGAQGFSG